jgi:hypothetical protein
MDTKIFDQGVDSFLNDFRSLITESEQTVRTYNRTKEIPKYVPDQARFKLVVWFIDGNRRYFFSYDTAYFDKRVHVDEFSALKKLIRLVNNYKGLFKNAIIYTSLDPDRKTTGDYCYQVAKWNINGKMSTNNAIRFFVDGQNNILDLDKLRMYGNKKI